MYKIINKLNVNIIEIEMIIWLRAILCCKGRWQTDWIKRKDFKITYTAQDTVFIVIDIFLLTKKKLNKHPLQSYINQ